MFENSTSTKVNNISIERIFTTEKTLTEILLEEMKLVVMGDKREWDRNSFFFEISVYQDSDAPNKIQGFSLQNSSTSVVF